MEENYMHELDVIKRRNHYIIFIGVILILIASGFCLLRDWTRRVEEPIMLPVYMDVGVDISEWDENKGEVNIQLYYLTDNKFDNSVIGITFPERPELISDVGGFSDFSVYSYDSFYGNESTNLYLQCGRYQIHKINVDLSSIPLEEEIKLTKAELFWQNGEYTVVDIGTVNLYNNAYDPNSLISQYSGSSSDGILVVDMEVTDDITIESIESPFLFYTDGEYTVDINGNMYQASELNNIDIDFKKGDYVEITINRQGVSNPKFNQYYFIDIKPKLLYKDKNGKQAYERIYNISESLEYRLISENQIYQYLKERGKD